LRKNIAINAPIRNSSDARNAVILPVAGMNCASCVGRVEKALKSVPGLKSASVKLATEQAEVTGFGPIAYGDLVAAVKDASYAVPATRTELAIEGRVTVTSLIAAIDMARSCAYQRSNSAGHSFFRLSPSSMRRPIKPAQTHGRWRREHSICLYRISERTHI